MRNSFLARSLCAAVSASLITGSALPSTVRASDWEYSFEDDQQFVVESTTEDAGYDFVWEDPSEEVPAQEPETGPPAEVPDPVEEIPDPVPVVEDPTPAPSVDFWDDQPTVAPDPEVTTSPTPSDVIPTPGEVVEEEPFEFVAEISVTPTPVLSVTPSPTPTPTPNPTVTPLVATPVTVTTSMISNLHAGKEFYLNSLKSSYALSFADGFDKVMDEIEYEYLAENHLIRPDGTRGVTDEAYLQYLQEQQWVQAQKAQEAAARTEATDGLVVLDFDGFTSDAAVSMDSSWDNFVLDSAGGDPLLAATATEAVTEATLDSDLLFDSFTSGPEEKFNDLVAPEGLLARNWQDVLAVYVYQQVKLGAMEFNLNRSAKQALSEIFREMNPITFNGNTPAYGNYHVGDYVRLHNIPKWDRVVLKKYTETDCKLLCATVTAAKGFVRQSVGDYVSEERVNVIAAAYSLVGKVGYFWGGKSTYLGVDPRWGQAQVVTAEGSGTSGTLRAYGLDCSGFVTWAVINGYQNTGMRAYVGDGTSEQWNLARVVSEMNAQPGDFVFQSGPEAGANNHVGILVGKTDSGDWIAVHCSSGQNGVTVGEAYSASFRYIREPSFYPLKTTSVVIAPENIDDILVPADVTDGYDLGFSDGFSDGLPTEYVNEDFMDIVLFDTAQSQEPDVFGFGDGVYDIAPATEGLVVLDESGRGDTLGYLVSPTTAPVFTNPASDLVIMDEDGTNEATGSDFFFFDETPVLPAEESILIEDTEPVQQEQQEIPAVEMPEDYGDVVALDDWGELSETEDIQAAAEDPSWVLPEEEEQGDLVSMVPVEEPVPEIPEIPEIPATEDSFDFTDALGLVVLEDLNGDPLLSAPAEVTTPQVLGIAPVYEEPSVVAAPQVQPDYSVMSQLVVLEDLSSEPVGQIAPADQYVVNDKMLEVVTLDFTGEEAMPEQTRTASENLVENVYQRLRSDGMVQDAYNAVAETGINQESGLVGNILRSPAVTVTPIPVRAVEQPVVPCDASSIVVICFD